MVTVLFPTISRRKMDLDKRHIQIILRNQMHASSTCVTCIRFFETIPENTFGHYQNVTKRDGNCTRGARLLQCK